MPDETRQVSVLLIEDHRDIAAYIVDFLETSGYEVDFAADGITGLHLAVSQVRRRRARRADAGRRRHRGLPAPARGWPPRTPVLMLTARDAVHDRVLGLEAGADDYLVKPFALDELVARLRALLRRTAAPPRARLTRSAT